MFKDRKVLEKKIVKRKLRTIPKPIVRHEEVDYLKLRRTEESKRALCRNRDAVLETIEPTVRHPESSSNAYSKRLKRIEALEKDEAQLRHLDDYTTIKSIPSVQYQPDPILIEMHDLEIKKHKKVLEQSQFKARKAEKRERQKVMQTMETIRDSISSMYVFTPTFRIWSRFKTKSALDLWKDHVVRHRAWEAEFKLLECYAIQIQKIFRVRRGRRLGAVFRKIQISLENQSATFIQAWFRGVLDRIQFQNMKEALVATQLQAVWRGKVARQRVKGLLKQEVRLLLRFFSPTGSLHRLRQVATYSDDLRALISHALMLVEDTEVSITRVKTAIDTSVPVHSSELYVHVTRRELFHCVSELLLMIDVREKEINEAKQQFEERRQQRLSMEREIAEREKQKALLLAREKIIMEQELKDMAFEERYMQEYDRMVRNEEDNFKFRQTKLEMEREQEENTAMEMEDILTRHIIATLKKRKQDQERHQKELDRVKALNERLEAELLVEIRYREEMALVKKVQVEKIRQKRKEEEKHELKMRYLQEKKAMRVRLNERQRVYEEEMKRVADEEKKKHEKHDREQRKMEEKRRRHQFQLQCEWKERMRMEKEDALVRRVILQGKKIVSSEHWENVHEQLSIEPPIDPLQFISARERKEIVEKMRQENLKMKEEDDRMHKIDAFYAKKRRLKLAKENKIFKDREMIFEASQRKLMEAEEKRERERLAHRRRRREYRRTLKRMKKLAERERKREEQRLKEAKSRKLMYDEEMRQRRYLAQILRIERRREGIAREAMTKQETQQRVVDAALERIRQRKLERKRRGEMTREDVISSKWNNVERDGVQLERIIWTRLEAAAFRQVVDQHGQFLRLNVHVLCDFADELKGSESPLPLDYHSFYDEKSAELKNQTDDQAPMDKALSPRSRWKWAFDRVNLSKRAKKLALQGYALLDCGKLDKGCVTLRKAFEMGDRSSRILRELGRAYFKIWLDNPVPSHLYCSYFYYQRASKRLELLCSPAFLVELASVLEGLGKFKKAAELMGRIVTGFQSYVKLNAVIFHAGVILVNMEMYEEATQYILHTLEDPPKPWKSHDILFIVARLYELGGKKKLSIAAYEQSFKSNTFDEFFKIYKNWKQWAADPEVWKKMGQRYMSSRLYILAKDAFQQALKRRTETLETDVIWMNLAISQTFLQDRKAASFAIKKWLKSKSYQDRVEESLMAWDAEKWNALGLGVPERLLEVESSEEEEVEEPTIDEYQQVEDAMDDNSTMYSNDWQQVTDPTTGDVYYWNPHTNETRWG